MGERAKLQQQCFQSCHVQCCVRQAWPPELGILFETSVLCWSFSDQSFWRGTAISMSEVISYAKSMSLTRFREARLQFLWAGFKGFVC